jgi:hypothetical protein
LEKIAVTRHGGQAQRGMKRIKSGSIVDWSGA